MVSNSAINPTEMRCGAWEKPMIGCGLSMLLLLSMTSCQASRRAAEPPTPQVTVARPLQRDVVDWDEYIGHFEAPQSVNLRARVTGVVTEILFKDGQDVTQGQSLIVIDPRPYRAALLQAKAQAASINATLENAKLVEARSEK